MSELESTAMARKLAESFEAYGRASGKISGETMLSMLVEEDVGKLCDTLAAGVLVNVADRQEILNCVDVRARAENLLAILRRETEIQKIEARIQKQVKTNVEKAQKEYYLREQLKVIHKELGEDLEEDDAEGLKEKLDALPLPEEVREKAEKELRRLAQLPSGSHEMPVVRNWLDWVIELPWGKTTEDNFDLVNARKVLDDEHYGLVKVKDRVVEHLAVCRLKNDTGGTILCLVGPPGVGKTSIATSVAHATGRAFTRMSLGGVRDEADIRGHRRTYIGAIPGRFITAMKQAGSMNPVMLLDEVDKLCSDMRGDPASALLEVLDSNQNSEFRDHYMEIPFDLSKVLFITTANTTESIPQPLLDRMDVITLSSYTEEEKLEIGKRHLLQKQIAAHGLPPKSVSLPDESIRELIECYTREAGVRELERRIADICRKVAVSVVTEGKKRAMITPRQIEKLLGPEKYKKNEHDVIDKVGVANGLAWTQVGGELLRVEVAVLKGKGNLELTGRMGDVMRESAQAAFTYIRTHAAEWDIDPLFYEKVDIHIHIPEGAVPKDGPSAGITMACAMVSALSGRAIRGDVAMTGEISLRGRVLPVGGLKEKTLAALREGMTAVILPKDNANDLPEFAESVRKNLNIVFADELSEVFEVALAKKNSMNPFIDEMHGYRTPSPEVVS
jgi:ATP-dependent Lon protease